VAIESTDLEVAVESVLEKAAARGLPHGEESDLASPGGTFLVEGFHGVGRAGGWGC
jgi:hypothetical protein